jgi:hypothetical protein
MMKSTFSPEKGAHSQMNLADSAFATPEILYRDKHGNERVLYCELYFEGDGENQKVWMHLLCPLCSRPDNDPPVLHALKVSDDRKELRIEEGKVYCNEIRCTWEEDGSLRRSHGFAQCSWHVRIEGNLALDV